MKKTTTTVVLAASLLLSVYSLCAQEPSPTPVVGHALGFAVSPPLRDLANMPVQHYAFHEANPVRRTGYHAERPFVTDSVEQNVPGAPSNISVGLSVLGLDNSESCNCQPPDTNAAVGDTQVVEWVNIAFAVYNKTTGAMEAGPIQGNQIWKNLGGPCYTTNTGDPIAQWDRTAHRWLLAQNTFTAPPYHACVAVSTSPDALGSYYLYSFSLGNNFPDYPKWGVWPSGYFETSNAFGNQFAGAYVCGYNSAKLLVGDGTAEQICFQLTPNDASLLPGDQDSNVAPPAGQDEFFIGAYDVDSSNNHLYLYSMHPVFSNPSQSTFVGSGLANPITVPTYTAFCPNSEFCVPQEGTSTKVDALGDRVMYRFAYWEDQPTVSVKATPPKPVPSQHWFVNHVTTASGGQAGVRWYEFTAPIKSVGVGGVSLFQSGTFAPDSNYRWMASLTRDKVGDIALGYSISSTTMYDSINATGRVPGDPLGQMEAEVSLFAGTGSQSSGDRWGDYSSMSIDGSDGCTFWYAQEYYAVPGAGDPWQTRLTSLKFAGCQ